MIVWVVYAWVVVNVVLLLLAFVLRLLGASTDAGFVEWVYRSTDAAMRPFRGVFPSRELGDSSVLDTSLRFAVVVYLIVAMVVHAFLQWLSIRLAAQDEAISRARTDADRLAQRYEWARAAARRADVERYEIARAAAAEVVAAQQAGPPTVPWVPSSGSLTSEQLEIARAAAREALAAQRRGGDGRPANVPSTPSPSPPPPPAR